MSLILTTWWPGFVAKHCHGSNQTGPSYPSILCPSASPYIQTVNQAVGIYGDLAKSFANVTQHNHLNQAIASSSR